MNTKYEILLIDIMIKNMGQDINVLISAALYQPVIA